MAGSLQSPVCGDPEGNLWVWLALGTRLQFPASFPSHIPPKFFFPTPERPEEAEAPKDRKGGVRA